MFSWKLVPGKGQLRTITHVIRMPALLLHRSSGTPAKFVFPPKVCSLTGVRVGGGRVRSYTHEGVRVKAEKLARVRAARSMMERSLLTCLSSLYDVHSRLVPAIGRYRTTTHIYTPASLVFRERSISVGNTRQRQYWHSIPLSTRVGTRWRGRVV